jgi:hypothetical protein
MRKRILAVCGLLAVLACSGCVAFITGDTVEFESEPAIVPNETATANGFTLQEYNETNINESIEIVGQEREIRISFHQAVYSSIGPDNVTTNGSVDPESVDREALNESMQNGSSLNETLRPTALTIISVPDAQVLGQSVNPLVRLPNDELVKRFGSNEGSVSNLEESSTRQVSMLDSETEVSVFESTAERDGQSSDAMVSIAKLPHEGDVVIFVGIEPGANETDAGTIDTFLENVEHPAEAPN